ncbi:protein CLEC16A homolog isoform X1 [Hyalella azteca]|uniref:Protein CLEC16A homolog isoform X1 n=1 Tax=Hyalella azteca TaxID=294128 RepID=A0A979FW63_HYAAZ|nr:protein CLEC16A homolog isoform X1 [Hyalella azteca]
MLRKNWFGGVFKPKNLHSLEHLRYLYSVLSKNQVVSESNRGLLVETLRSIAEILIWGDQNDSSVFDFFLEKQMLSFFLRIMKQKCGSYVCVQLLQTLNILFENIRNETSLYYLLSNNHVNFIIEHKFDFSDEEVMAYYISFLKTLSFKLNSHTIHFFYNEHTNDFPLYTEAIKFFNHPESMVRIAVRTLTLNVYRVNDQSMLQFIRDKTAVPYFSNLVWFIGNHILELDACVRDDIDHDSRDRLSALVAEHLDHLHYLNDILQLHITPLNHLLAHHLLHRLLLPLLVNSLLPADSPLHRMVEQRRLTSDFLLDSASEGSPSNPAARRARVPRVSKVVALFLLAQVFLILAFPPLLKTLARSLLHAGASLLNHYNKSLCPSLTGFVAPKESLEKSLLSHGVSSPCRARLARRRGDLSPAGDEQEPQVCEQGVEADASTAVMEVDTSLETCKSEADLTAELQSSLNITDEEKQQMLAYQLPPCCLDARWRTGTAEEDLSSRPFLQSVLDALNCRDSDYTALFSLCLLYALAHNAGFSDPDGSNVSSQSEHNFKRYNPDPRDNEILDPIPSQLSASTNLNPNIDSQSSDMPSKPSHVNPDRDTNSGVSQRNSVRSNEVNNVVDNTYVPLNIKTGLEAPSGGEDDVASSCSRDDLEGDPGKSSSSEYHSGAEGYGPADGSDSSDHCSSQHRREASVLNKLLMNDAKSDGGLKKPGYSGGKDATRDVGLQGSDNDGGTGERSVGIGEGNHRKLSATASVRRSSDQVADGVNEPPGCVNVPAAGVNILADGVNVSSGSVNVPAGSVNVSAGSVNVSAGSVNVSPGCVNSPAGGASYNSLLVDKMLHVISLSTQYNSKVRVVTLEIAIHVLKQVVGLTSPAEHCRDHQPPPLCNGVTNQDSDAERIRSRENSSVRESDNSRLEEDPQPSAASIVFSASCSCPEASGEGPCTSCSALPKATVSSPCHRKDSSVPSYVGSENNFQASANTSSCDANEIIDLKNKVSDSDLGVAVEERPSRSRGKNRPSRPVSGNKALLSDEHLAALEGAREEATLVLRNYYKSEEMFLDLFEDEWSHSGCGGADTSSRPMSESLRVEYLLQDSSILLPPTATPLTGIALNRRRPCGEVERARRAMRVFFLVRGACLAMRGEHDTQLPLTRPSACVRVNDVLDLNNSDLIACVVIPRDGERCRRFLVIDVLQLILVEPDQRRLGWGVAKFVGFLQYLEVSGDKDDSRVLHLTIHHPASAAAASTSSTSMRPSTSRAAPPPAPLLSAKFIFDDHIRCMAAKQRLCKGRNKARQRKLQQIARLLELPSHILPSCPSPPSHPLSAMRLEAHHHHRRGLSGHRGSDGRSGRSGRVPGRATSQSFTGGLSASLTDSGHYSDAGRSPRPAPEEIALEDLPAPPTAGAQGNHPYLRRL